MIFYERNILSDIYPPKFHSQYFPRAKLLLVQGRYTGGGEREIPSCQGKSWHLPP